MIQKKKKILTQCIPDIIANYDYKNYSPCVHVRKKIPNSSQVI